AGCPAGRRHATDRAATDKPDRVPGMSRRSASRPATGSYQPAATAGQSVAVVRSPAARRRPSAARPALRALQVRHAESNQAAVTLGARAAAQRPQAMTQPALPLVQQPTAARPLQALAR